MVLLLYAKEQTRKTYIKEDSNILKMINPSSSASASASTSVLSSKPKRAILLDFDGVVLKKCAAHDLVASRSHMYVKRFIPRASDSLCNEIYTTYGHTVRGLQALGFNANKTTYNQFVYQYIDQTYFQDVRAEQRHQRATADLFKFVGTCIRYEIPLYIFSNAPDGWCKTALKVMDPKGDLEAAMPSLSHLMNDSFKPDKSVYDNIEKVLSEEELWFVDDRLANFVPIMDNLRWKKTLICEYDADDHVQVNNSFFYFMNDFQSFGTSSD